MEETLYTFISVVSGILVGRFFSPIENTKKRVDMQQRQLETQHQQIQALKARLEALEPKDEVDKFMETINKI